MPLEASGPSRRAGGSPRAFPSVAQFGISARECRGDLTVPLTQQGTARGMPVPSRCHRDTPARLPAQILELGGARAPGWHTWSAEGSAGPVRGGGRNLELEFPGVCTSPARPYKKAAAAAALPLGRLIPGAALPKGPPDLAVFPSPNLGLFPVPPLTVPPKFWRGPSTPG